MSLSYCTYVYLRLILPSARIDSGSCLIDTIFALFAVREIARKSLALGSLLLTNHTRLTKQRYEGCKMWFTSWYDFLFSNAAHPINHTCIPTAARYWITTKLLHTPLHYMWWGLISKHHVQLELEENVKQSAISGVFAWRFETNLGEKLLRAAPWAPSGATHTRLVVHLMMSANSFLS